MNPSMWLKALRIIPRIDKDEWEKLDVISKWLISTHAGDPHLFANLAHAAAAQTC